MGYPQCSRLLSDHSCAPQLPIILLSCCPIVSRRALSMIFYLSVYWRPLSPPFDCVDLTAVYKVRETWARIPRYFKVTAENIAIVKGDFSDGILKQPAFSLTAVLHCQREEKPREELLREYWNLGEGGPLCTQQASQHGIFCTAISRSTEYTVQAGLLCTQRTTFS